MRVSPLSNPSVSNEFEPDRSLSFVRRHLNASLSALARLHILTPEIEDSGNDEGMPSEAATINDSTVFVLNTKFRTSLRQALTGG